MPIHHKYLARAVDPDSFLGEARDTHTSIVPRYTIPQNLTKFHLRGGLPIHHKYLARAVDPDSFLGQAVQVAPGLRLDPACLQGLSGTFRDFQLLKLI